VREDSPGSVPRLYCPAKCCRILPRRRVHAAVRARIEEFTSFLPSAVRSQKPTHRECRERFRHHFAMPPALLPGPTTFHSPAHLPPARPPVRSQGAVRGSCSALRHGSSPLPAGSCRSSPAPATSFARRVAARSLLPRVRAPAGESVFEASVAQVPGLL